MLTRTMTALVLLGLYQAAIGQQPSRQELVVAGKQATALVVDKELVTGTAVCIDPRGYFVSAFNVLRRAGAVSLVLDSGLPSQRVLAAEVVVSDPANGFVLLHTPDADGLHALPLGTDDELIETAEVLLFGFPVFKPTVKNQAFPNMGVSIGNVTSLRRARGHLASILFDAELHPAYLGGPVVDRSGRIVGLIERVTSNSSVHSSVPVSKLRTFLTKVNIAFTPPQLNVRESDQPVELSVRVDSLHPEGALDVALELSSSPLDQRTIPLSSAGENLYKASVVPVPKIEGSDPIEIEAQFAAGRLSCRVNNQEVRVGDRVLRLDEIARIQRNGEQFSVELRNDETITAASLAGFPARADLGGYELPVDLLKAGELLLRRPEPPAALQFAVVVSDSGKEIARRKGEWRLERTGGSGSSGGFTDDGDGSIEFLPLSGDAAWPGFLEQIPGSVFDEGGLRVPADAAVRSRMADLLDANFQFDVELTFRPTGDDAACVGLGEANVKEGGASRSVFLRLHPTYLHQGNIGLIKQPGDRGENMAESNLRTNGPHRVTVTKRGDVVTFAADLDCDGPTPDDVLYTIPDIRTFAPFLDEKNTRVFFSRGATFSKTRFQRLPPEEAPPPRDDNATASFAPWPDFLQPAPNVIVGRSGLVLGENKFVASKIRGFATRDFTVDIEMMLPTERPPIAVIGLGVWKPGSSRPLEQSIYLRLHSLHHEGKIGLTVPGRREQPAGQFRRLGPHRVRIQRRGTTLTFHIDVDNDGPSPDDATRTVPNIMAVMPYLHEKNTQLFFGSGHYRSIRLTEP